MGKTVDEIFADRAKANRIASIEAEKTRRPIREVDWDAIEAAEREKRHREFEEE